MKTIWIFGILAFFLAAPAVSGADLPDLVGTWEGPDMGYDPLEGYYGEGENYTVTLTMIDTLGCDPGSWSIANSRAARFAIPRCRYGNWTC